MVEKISSLTDEQTARFPEFVEKWTNIGLATARSDRAKAEEVADKMYIASGNPLPKKKIWCNSPVELLIWYTLYSNPKHYKIIEKITGNPA